MPQEVQQAFGDWLRDPEARTEKEQTLETYWERLEAAERPGRDRKLARLHEAIRRFIFSAFRRYSFKLQPFSQRVAYAFRLIQD